MTGKCPRCGAPANWRELLSLEDPGRSWDRREYHTYGFALDAAIAAGAEYERRRPSRPATLESDVFVPGLQALITGVTAGVCVGTLVAVADWPHLAATIGMGVAAGAMGATWLVLLGTHRKLLWEIERVSGMDWDQDGMVGEPPPPPPMTKVEIVSERGRRYRYVDVPLNDAELRSLADAVLRRGVGFARRALAASDALIGEKYGDVMRAMLKGGLLRERGGGPNSGVELTPAGRAFLRQYLE